jgi:hypothetical protein
MIFFVVYTAYENLYRKTSSLLCIFTAFFILAQYWFSLSWKLDQDPETGKLDPQLYKSYKWANIIPLSS